MTYITLTSILTLAIYRAIFAQSMFFRDIDRLSRRL
jgi:hypothetical protein